MPVCTDFHDKLGPDAFFRTEEQALDHAWKKPGDGHEADCPLNVACPLKP